jgi:hypothetical protein
LDDLREGLRILKEGVVSLFVQGTEQASLLKYKVQLTKLDHQLQDCYRGIGERVFLKLSASDDKMPPIELEETELIADKELRQLFKTAASLEQEKEELLDEMKEMS